MVYAIAVVRTVIRTTVQGVLMMTMIMMMVAVMTRTALKHVAAGGSAAAGEGRFNVNGVIGGVCVRVILLSVVVRFKLLLVASVQGRYHTREEASGNVEYGDESEKGEEVQREVVYDVMRG